MPSSGTPYLLRMEVAGLLVASGPGSPPQSPDTEPTPPASAPRKQAPDLTTPPAKRIVFYAQVTLPSPETQDRVAVQHSVNTPTLDFRRTSDSPEHTSVAAVAVPPPAPDKTPGLNAPPANPEERTF